MMATGFEAIVIGGSSGALDALSVILPALPASFAAPIAIVLHLPPHRPSMLADVLAARCALPVREANDKDPLEPSTVFVAPPNYHLLIERAGSFALSIDPPLHYSRPAIDVLFESAADAYGDHLLAVLLAGANDDGVRGLARVKAQGGTAIVQDPASARTPEMPAAALRSVAVDAALAPPDIAAYLLDSASRPSAKSCR